ncbi:sensor histidine kinase [Aquiflexum gelatinilyticum]|uniref:histidine kinase n=1 Tax=Aquiflexum gelatinilyticum TaxID=2961943 RepID=A0A9X2PAY5_9BACT|nr:ATP-binding protein [Aquiflexum gelatinilyticum]MCR9016905.1 ATP-binding protein [Aquiflexum gelatinilyticum]
MENDGSDLFLIILLGFFLMIVMVSFIVIMVVFHRQRQIKNQQLVKEIQAEYEKTILNVEKELREDILSYVGRELHDNVGQLLSLAKMNLSSSKPEKVSEGKGIVNEIIHEVRALSKSLNLDWVEKISLEDYIQRELKKLESSEFCKVVFHQSGDILHLEKDKKLVLIRIIQESLNNAIKHAQPKMIEISIDSDTSRSLIKVIDDGKGFDYTGESSGSGIYNLKNRMATIGGEMKLHSIPGKGTEIKLILPNQKA